ncbi:MAG: hypothetical protein M3Z05_17700 [Gemmatimonadota bacterium]|nr:hypothetical protein [Gemmatimonadota bacterium]
MHGDTGRRGALVFAGMILNLLSGCSGTTGSDSNSVTGQSVSKATTVTYDFTTSLQTVYAPSGSCLVSDCTHSTTAAPASSSLTGRLFMRATTDANGLTQYPVDSLVLSEIDASLARVVNYGRNVLVVAKDTLVQMTTFSGSGEGIYFYRAVVAADSITGSLRWYTLFGVASRYYDASFIARRRP